jgi:hypothetical protein
MASIGFGDFSQVVHNGILPVTAADFPPNRHFEARKALFSVGFTGGLGACEQLVSRLKVTPEIRHNQL